MLVLSRKRGEKIVVCCGDQVTIVEVLATSGGRVRLGVSAPPEVVVHRSEVWSRATGRGTARRAPDDAS